MSAALQSLMRDVPRSVPSPNPLVGVFNFIGIGATGAAAFVMLSTLVMWLDPDAERWMINAACYAATILPVYLMHRRFSFDSDASHVQAFPRYFAVQAMALVLAAVFSFVINGVLSLPTFFASMLVIGLTSGVNYLVLRSWAFARGRVTATVAA
ncbi:GtrA family protein [Devosia sp. SL43]|uniref:GtrA family protein n=1 Tax=Devosia sp. SL43 TaxID=2806348 RepID=UPI001F2AA520|nr:GtrA family protein [Devosia sp. SL43]UJW87074.1 GtrA family protein [Devosia sp. SL43]